MIKFRSQIPYIEKGTTAMQAHCTVVLDKLNGLEYEVHVKRALYLSTNYPTRFAIKSPKHLLKELHIMARLVDKHPVPYQEKLTLEDVKDLDLTLDDLEEKDGTSGIYFLLRVTKPDKKTGYISMGFKPICDVLKTVDVKKELPSQITFTKIGGSWNMK